MATIPAAAGPTNAVGMAAGLEVLDAVPLDSAVPSALDTEEVVDRVPVTIMMSLVVVPVV